MRIILKSILNHVEYFVNENYSQKTNINWRHKMNEMDIWTYMVSVREASGIQGIGVILLIGIGFGISSAIYNSENANIIGRVAATVFVLCVAMGYLFNGAITEWNFNQAAAGLAFLAETTEGISPGGQMIIEANDPGAPFSMIPDLIPGLFLVSVLVMQLAGIWTKK